MRASAGIVAVLVLFGFRCSLTTEPNCVAGSEYCACSNGACDNGLSCVSGTCFDIGDLGNPANLGSREGATKRNQSGRRTTQAQSDAGASGVGGHSVDASMSKQADAGAGGRNATEGRSDAGPSKAFAADGGTHQAAECAALEMNCTNTICCEGTSCINRTCRLPCSGNSDCSTHCCLPFDATRSVCMESSLCEATTAGDGGHSGAGSAGRAGGAAGSCSAAGAACGTQACCAGVSCVNNICAARCSTEADCASACCLAFLAGLDKACVPSNFCRR